MSVEFFIDSNVLIYAATGAGTELAKRQRAFDVLKQGRIGLSTQVLQEFYVTVTRKVQIKLSSAQAVAWIEQLEQAECFVVDKSAVKAAVATSNRFKISYWDAAIVIAAQALEAKVLYSEDLNHGKMFGSVQKLNPFVGL